MGIPDWIRTSWHAFDAIAEGLRGAYRGFWIWMRIRWDEHHQPSEDLSLDTLLKAYRKQWQKLEEEVPACPEASCDSGEQESTDSDPTWVPSASDLENDSETITLANSECDEVEQPTSR